MLGKSMLGSCCSPPLSAVTKKWDSGTFGSRFGTRHHSGLLYLDPIKNPSSLTHVSSITRQPLYLAVLATEHLASLPGRPLSCNLHSCCKKCLKITFSQC